MVNVFKLINLVFCLILLNLADSNTKIKQLVDAALEGFYLTKYIADPLVVNSVARFIQEANAVIQISEGINSGHVHRGLTTALRPYRVEVNKALAALEGTRSSQCAFYDKWFDIDLYSASAAGYVIDEVQLFNTSRATTASYVKQYAACAKGVTNNLRSRISILNTLLGNQKSMITNISEDVIRGCGDTYSLKYAQQCIENFMEQLWNVYRQLLVVLISDTADTKDVGNVVKLTHYDKTMFSIPNCLLYTYVDAIHSANTILRQIQQCARSTGDDISLNQISVADATQNIQTVLNFLGPYYNVSRQALAPEFILLVYIEALFGGMDQSERALNENTTVESVLAASVKAKRVLRIAAQSTNVTLKTCVYEAFKYVKSDTAQKISSYRSCAQDSLDYATSLQSFVNATYSRIFGPLKPGPVAQIPDCIIRNILNTTTLEQCTSEIYTSLENELSTVNSAYDAFVAEGIKTFDIENEKPVTSCNSTVPSLTSVYQCDEILFSFLL